MDGMNYIESIYNYGNELVITKVGNNIRTQLKEYLNTQKYKVFYSDYDSTIEKENIHGLYTL